MPCSRSCADTWCIFGQQQSLPVALPKATFLEAGLIVAILASALATAATVGKTAVGVEADRWLALAWIAVNAAVLTVPDSLVAARPAVRGRSPPALILAGDLAINNGPNVSTALPPANYEILNPNCSNETVALPEREAAPDARIAMA